MAGHKVLMSSATVCIFRHLKFHPAIQFVQFDWYETGNDHPFIYCVYIILKSREKYDLLLLFMTVWRNFQEKIKLRDGNMYIFFPSNIGFFWTDLLFVSSSWNKIPDNLFVWYEMKWTRKLHFFIACLSKILWSCQLLLVFMIISQDL